MARKKGKGGRKVAKEAKTPVTMRKRYAIRELSLAGMANCDIEKALKVGHSCVQKWANTSPPPIIKRPNRKSCVDLDKAKATVSTRSSRKANEHELKQHTHKVRSFPKGKTYLKNNNAKEHF